MGRILTAAFPLFAGICLYAQPGVYSTRPANPSDGKILTMEETVLSRELSPKYDGYYFGENGLEQGTRPSPARGEVSSLGYVALNEGNGIVISTGDRKFSIGTEDEDGIVYGTSVSRNEFGISKGLFWSPDGEKLAFYRKDERKVTLFPLLDINTRTGKLVNIRYPMAGMDSEVIGLGVFDARTGKSIYLKVTDFDDNRYLTNICWTPDSRYILIQVLDRFQKHVHLNKYDASTGRFVRTILTENNERFVEPQNPVWFLEGSDSEFIYRTDNRDGFRNLYHCDTLGRIGRITAVDADVAYVGNNGKEVFYTSAEVSPVENHFFKQSLGKLTKNGYKPGKVTRLTEAEGWHEITLSPDRKTFLDRYSSLTNPGTTDICGTDGKGRSNLFRAEDPTKGYAYTEISLGRIKSADGKYDNYYRMIMPKDFDPSKKYPVIIYVYGGPHSQMVSDKWLGQLRRWEMYMAQRGYLVYVQDNRGTQNRGAEFEKSIYRQCGKCEMEDQIEGVRMLCSLPYVDTDRIGVHGWSYGGFMTISLMTTYPQYFKVAVAGGPVIDWKWYEVMYGERYMSTPELNPEGYASTSLINKADKLKGKLLICQGAIDGTVVWEHSLSFIQECIEKNIPVDYFPYPRSEHNVAGKWRVHLMDKISAYFDDYL